MTMKYSNLLMAAAILCGIAAGCSSSSDEPMSKPMDAAKLQEQGISEGTAPGSGGTQQNPSSTTAPPASANTAQGDL